MKYDLLMKKALMDKINAIGGENNGKIKEKSFKSGCQRRKC